MNSTQSLTPPEEPEAEPHQEELPRLVVPDMVARELPSADEVRAAPWPFVCPIFEEECPLKTRSKKKAREPAASN